jgi:hypothetical protein
MNKQEFQAFLNQMRMLDAEQYETLLQEMARYSAEASEETADPAHQRVSELLAQARLAQAARQGN